MKQNTFLKKMDNIRKGAINAAATVISAPSVLRSRMRAAEGESNYRVLKEANDRRDEPDFNPDGSVTRGFKARSVAKDIKAKMLGKKK